MPWTRVNTNPLWINNALCTFFSVTYVVQVLSATRANTFTSKLKSTRELQSETTWAISRICPQMTLREIVGKSQSKLDCLIFGMLFIILGTETNTKQTERFHQHKLFV